MPKHEFGIMLKDPPVNKWFNTYEPHKYNCIAIDDDFILPIIVDLKSVDCYWHTLQKAEKGLAYYGITLIPPQSMDTFIKVLSSQNRPEYDHLVSVAKRAKELGKFIIHFGI